MKKHLKYIFSIAIVFFITVLNISCSKDKEVGLVYGVESAPIVIKNYTSFQCPDCSELHLKLHDVLKKYIDNGDVKYIEKQIDIAYQNDEDVIKLLNLKEDDNKNNISDLKRIRKEKEKLDIHAVPTVYINGEEMSNKITAEELEEKLKSLLK